MEQGRDTHDTAWVPLITGIEEPFKKILETVKSSLEGEIALEGARKALEACAAIAEVQERSVGEYTEEYMKVKVGYAVRAIKDGQPVLGPEWIVPPGDALKGLFLELLQALGVGETPLKKLEGTIRNLGDRDKYFTEGLKVSPESFVQDFIGGIDIDQNIFLAAYNAAYQTFAATEASVIRPYIERETWNLSTCPICGSHPEMGRIEASEGHMYLVCPLCLTEWKQPRLKCPWCGNEDQNTLGFFMAEEYPGYRVNFCRDCSGYLKATVEKTLNRRHVPTVDNLLTLELDLQAEREGFKRPE